MPDALRRLLWFLGLWAGGVLTVGAVAYGLRALIGL
jgi:hypothetical protein